VIAGEASSHCVKATTEHLADYLPSGRVDKLVLLADCMSPVTGFEAQAQDFLAAMQRRGALVTTSRDYLPTLQANA
jgi:nicotinamidase/pyrazinamidase